MGDYSNEIYISDICIWISDCLRDVDNVNTDWRAIMKYIEDFCDDNNIDINIVKLGEIK